jgi:PRTRC genetic system protein A
MPACLYQYVIAANGIFVRARRPGLEAMLMVGPVTDPVRGLVPVQPYVHVDRLMPAWMVEKLFRRAYLERGREILFYARLNPGWSIAIPAQVQSGGSVHPVNPFAGGTDTLLEIHSHHNMNAFFSGTDNQDERAGFRLFAVLGRVGSQQPEIHVRVGIYGHFWSFPARWVFELPEFVVDVVQPRPELVYEEVEDVA